MHVHGTVCADESGLTSLQPFRVYALYILGTEFKCERFSFKRFGTLQCYLRRFGDFALTVCRPFREILSSILIYKGVEVICYLYEKEVNSF